MHASACLRPMHDDNIILLHAQQMAGYTGATITVMLNNDGTWTGGKTYTVMKGHADFWFLVNTVTPFEKIYVVVSNLKRGRQSGALSVVEEINLCQISRPLAKSYFGPKKDNARRTHRRLNRANRRKYGHVRPMSSCDCVKCAP